MAMKISIGQVKFGEMFLKNPFTCINNLYPLVSRGNFMMNHHKKIGLFVSMVLFLSTPTPLRADITPKDAAWLCVASVTAGVVLNTISQDFLKDLLNKDARALSKHKLPEQTLTAIKQILDLPHCDREAIFKKTAQFPWNKEPHKTSSALAIHAFLHNNRCLFGEQESRIANILALNQIIPNQIHKIIVVTESFDLERDLATEAIAVATGRPYYTIDCRERSKDRKAPSFFGESAPSSNGHIGELFRIFSETESVNPVIVLKNFEDIDQECLESICKILDGSLSIEDRYFKAKLPTQNITFIASTQNTAALPESLTKTFATRLEVVPLAPYTREDNVEVTYRFLLPEVLNIFGIKQEQMSNLNLIIPLIVDLTTRGNQGLAVTKAALSKVITHYLYDLLSAQHSLQPYELKQERIVELIKQSLPSIEPITIELPEHAARIIRQKIADVPLNINAYKNVISSFPWQRAIPEELNKNTVADALKSNLVDLEKQKKAAFNFLIAHANTPKQHKKALCIVGPSGTGKTALAQLIAQASQRKNYLINIGHHPALSGEPLSMSNSSAGEIFTAMCKTHTQAPVIILDNIDKAHPYNMNNLVKALSPKLNDHFLDNFADFTIDLSKTLFVATATDVSGLSSELLEHLECIHLDEYSQADKEKITLQGLLPQALSDVAISLDAIQEIRSCIPSLVELVSPRSQGVHELKRALQSLVLQQIAAQELSGSPLGITPSNVASFIDPLATALQLSKQKGWREHCNELFRKLSIPADIFKKIEAKISSLTIWKGAESLIPLYADAIFKFPFGKMTKANISLAETRKQLDATHAGITPIKEMILDFLAGHMASNQTTTKIICFTGAPGIGKTTITESIAKSLGRKFAKISFGGLSSLSAQSSGNHDDLSGPGPIAKALCDADSLNPVILLDELEKAPEHLLPQILEILDPAQNKAFLDRYLGFELDLSNVMFIASANDASALASSLKNRMHMIQMHAYSGAERIEIAKTKLIPEIVTTMNFNDTVRDFLMNLVEPLVDKIVKREHGVRVLKRALQLAADKYARLILEDKPLEEIPVEIILGQLHPEMLQGDPSDVPATSPVIGITNGMYANGADGGGLLKIVASVIPGGKGELIKNILHGKMSCESHIQTLAFVKSHAAKYNIKPELLTTSDFAFTDQLYDSVNGPSAGVAQTVALVSALTKRPVRPGFAMTGAIDTYGNLLPVGGYRAKILGTAHTGIKKFLIPDFVRPTIEALKDDFNGLEIIFVKTIDDAIDILLEPAN